MNINDMKESRFFSKRDLPAPPQGAALTITGLTEENVAQQNAAPEMKFCLHFAEKPKPFVLNQTNAKSIGELLGSNETNDWKGKQVEAYYNPTIEMGGKTVGGIRIRAIGGATQSADAAINNAFDDDIPL